MFAEHQNVQIARRSERSARSFGNATPRGEFAIFGDVPRVTMQMVEARDEKAAVRFGVGKFFSQGQTPLV